MSNLVIDSWAWIEYLDGSQLGSKAREVIMDEHNKLFTHAVSVAEIMSKERRRNKDPETAWRAITGTSKIVIADDMDSKEVGLLHAQVKSKNRNFGLADAFVLHTARKVGGKVLTGDPDFKGIPDAIMLG
jgi:predicted nucleic acid-binding protein